jgi:hypothetical protein
MSEIIGADTMADLKAKYDDDAQSDDSALLHVRTAIATIATLRLYQRNDLSHEDDGRKFKIDPENEKCPWEWQLQRDDRIQMENYYRELDIALKLLKENETFKKSERYALTSKLLIKNAYQLHWFGCIEESEYLYYSMVPNLYEAQKYIERFYGNGFESVIAKMDENNSVIIADEVATAAAYAVSKKAIALAATRNTLRNMPYAISKEVAVEGGLQSAPPSADDINRYVHQLMRDVRDWTDEMQRQRDMASGATTYDHLTTPENDKRNKYYKV